MVWTDAPPRYHRWRRWVYARLQRGTGTIGHSQLVSFQNPTRSRYFNKCPCSHRSMIVTRKLAAAPFTPSIYFYPKHGAWMPKHLFVPYGCPVILGRSGDPHIPPASDNGFFSEPGISPEHLKIWFQDGHVSSTSSSHTPVRIVLTSFPCSYGPKMQGAPTAGA